MLALGFSCGLPFYLVFQTLSAWLRQEGIQRSTIGLLSYGGLMYSIKFLWSPAVDRLRLPLLHRWLGQRRSWMLVAQIGIGFSLINLAGSDPSTSILHVAIGAVVLAFFAATQDISVDAWRIESAGTTSQGAMAAAYQVGYRLALICASAGALEVAHNFGWHASYRTMASLALIGIITTLLVREPERLATRQTFASEERVVRWLEARAHWPQALRSAGATFIGAVVCPLTDFIARYGLTLALSILFFMGSYRLTEFTMGPMANPFYVDHHYTLDQIAKVVKLFGLPMSMVGVVVAGILIARLGLKTSLVIGSVMIMCSNLGFAWLATTTSPSLLGLGLVNGLDNLAQGIHGTSLIAFLSSLTSPRYTATQYALFSSLYALPGKLLEGMSGFVVDAIGYPLFFIYTASLSIPALLALLWLSRQPTLFESPATARQ